MTQHSQEKEQSMNNDIPEILTRILQENQTEEEMRLFLQWYRTSQENKEIFFRLKHLYDRNKNGLTPDDSEIEASWERLWEKIKMRTSTDFPLRTDENTRKSSRRIITYARAAAIAIILIVTGIYVFHKEHEVTWVEIKTGIQIEPQTIQLPDGSEIRLNASSLFRYPKKFNAKNREVYLDGEAFFTVTKNERKPFIVHTDKQQVNVLGTEFNVLGYSVDPYTVTTLVTGKVKLETFDGENNLKNEIVMYPDQQVYFDKERNTTTVSDIVAPDATSWMKGVYSFKDTPLEEITRRLEKIFGVTIVIPDKAHRSEKYTGKFFSNQTVKEVVQILNFQEQFRYQLNNDTIFLYKK